ncbi:MAG: 1-acyl-sn-glycerol-3-phosphate acyltransferase [Alphaproteobacteria bacterium]|nr:1-acyl-sn-glycerol-3-phosphate acyltransferase [Alphaproteobacteria bacterium]
MGNCFHNYECASGGHGYCLGYCPHDAHPYVEGCTVIVLRSIVFNIVFYMNLILFLVFGAWLLACPRIWAIRGLQLWARSSLWWLKVICNVHMEVRGREHLMDGPCLVAGKHQSFWETFAILPLFNDPCMVLKRELTFIPLFGWFALKFKMIAVERSAGSAALRKLVARAKEEVARGRPIIIMPEGTRRNPGDAPDYKPGAAALYNALGLPCLPFGLNSGVFWPRRKFWRKPGTIVIEFLPAIPAGLNRKAFQIQMEKAIEASSDRLFAET